LQAHGIAVQSAGHIVNALQRQRVAFGFEQRRLALAFGFKNRRLLVTFSDGNRGFTRTGRFGDLSAARSLRRTSGASSLPE
jgi:hypothetical protein